MNFKFTPVYVLAILLFFTPYSNAQTGGETAEKKATSEIAVVDDSTQAAGNQEKNTQVKINWSKIFNESLSEAKTAKKPIMIFVYATWCGWCKKMERDTCADKKIVKLSESFVCLKINPEEDEEFASKFKVKEFPSVIFLKSDASEIERHLGFKTADEFERIMKNVLETSK